MGDQTVSSGRWKGSLVALLVLTLFSIAFDFKLPQAKMSDPFHFGEYFVSSISLFGSNPNPASVTIHGALDYIPDNLTRFIYGNESNFFPTWFSYRIIDLAAQILLVCVCALIVKTSAKRSAILVAAAMAIPFMVGYRDLVLILSILLFFIARQASPRSRPAWEAALGVAAAFGVFWSFDRGLAGSVSLGLACLVGAFQARRNVVALAAFMVSVVALASLVPQFSFGAYWTNIRFLMATSSNWSYGWSRDPVILITCLLIAYLFVYSLYIPVLKNRPQRASHLEPLVFLLVFGAIEFKLSTNRADLQHIMMGSWPPLLMALYWYGNLKAIPSVFTKTRSLAILLIGCICIFITVKYKTVALVPILCLLAACMLGQSLTAGKYPALRNFLPFALLVPLVAAVFSIGSGARNGNYQWARYLEANPSNWSLASDGNAWAARQLIENGAGCVLDFSNNGIINGLANLPACTRFPYVAYADKRYEQEIIDALAQKKPSAVVYSAEAGHFVIDDISMHQKFPRVTKYISENYPIEVCQAGFCVRKMEIVR